MGIRDAISVAQMKVARAKPLERYSMRKAWPGGPGPGEPVKNPNCVHCSKPQSMHAGADRMGACPRSTGKTFEATARHTCNDGYGPSFGKRTAGCPRCDQMTNPAAVKQIQGARANTMGVMKSQTYLKKSKKVKVKVKVKVAIPMEKSKDGPLDIDNAKPGTVTDCPNCGEAYTEGSAEHKCLNKGLRLAGKEFEAEYKSQQAYNPAPPKRLPKVNVGGVASLSGRRAVRGQAFQSDDMRDEGKTRDQGDLSYTPKVTGRPVNPNRG